MAKAGLYAAEVTQAAPADGAGTLKAKGYQFLEHGDVAPPPTANELVFNAGPAAMYTFQDASFTTTLIDEMGTYHLDTVLVGASQIPPQVISSPWRSTNSQYCQVLAVDESYFQDTEASENNLILDTTQIPNEDFTLIWAFRSDDTRSGLKALVSSRASYNDQRFSIYFDGANDSLVFDMIDNAAQHSVGAFGPGLFDGLPHIISFRKVASLIEMKTDDGAWTSLTMSNIYWLQNAVPGFGVSFQPLGFTYWDVDYDLGAVYGKALTREQLDLIHTTYISEII